MIAVVDYGMGNLHSVAKALERVGAKVAVTRDPEVVAAADRVVLPGVGAFRDCLANLDRYGLREAVAARLTDGRPFLGICLGFQLLFERSHEFGLHQGFGRLAGEVLPFPADLEEGGARLKVPHMGWNEVVPTGDNPLFAGIPRGASFYFCHSYYAAPADPVVVAATCHYGIDFCCMVADGPLYGVQFHPEKSQRWGLKLLENFTRA
ncbi:MAG: imidazole glycerol phosphate synthase subunit HisH [Nitrospirae bacterium]|nr:MAG: imidazole glycerol phosphate synthase subunit HisH [Nitrospirota bacterium]